MIVKTKVFDYCNNGYKNLSELAQAMEISLSQIYRVREGTRHINEKFIVGAIKAFPDCKLDDLFYLVPESSTVNNHHQFSAAPQTEELTTKEKPITKSTKSTSAKAKAS